MHADPRPGMEREGIVKMKKTTAVVAAVAVCMAAFAREVKLDVSPDRVKTPLKVDMDRIGTLRPRGVGEIHGSNWTLGCETLDRDFAIFDEYKSFLAPLGIKTIRLQADVVFVDVPVYDSPCVLTERSAVEISR